MNGEDHDLRRYIEEVRNLPRPTSDSVERFVLYVADARSWYKHLPPFSPGRPFSFVLDPNAGRDLVLYPDGPRYKDRLSGDPHLHYSWRPTEEYRKSFGHLDYLSSAGPSLFFFVGGNIRDPQNRTRGPRILGADGTWIPVPAAVLKAGETDLTAFIHEYAEHREQILAMASRWIPSQDPPTPAGPLEAELWDLMERVYWSGRRGTEGPVSERWAAVARLQRKELISSLRAGITRMLDLAYGEGSTA